MGARQPDVPGRAWFAPYTTPDVIRLRRADDKVRLLKLLEWQGKRLLERAGLAVPRGDLADTPDSAKRISAELGGPTVVKAQVRSGGRGKLGAVVLAPSPAAAGEAARRLLGSRVGGLLVERVLVERAIDHEEELFLGLIIDHAAARPRVLLSASGGVDVESSADGAASYLIDPAFGLPPFAVRELVRTVGVRRQAASALCLAARALYQVFRTHHCTLAEVNPLALAGDGAPVALDVHISLDDSALARVPGLDELLSDTSGESVEEEIKRRYDFDYVEVDPDGDIGILSTGAGGTMMLLDVVRRAGGRPINFVDVRTGRLHGDPTRLVVLLRCLAAVPTLRVLLVSIFAGITDMEGFVRCLLAALEQVSLRCPVIIRLQGVNADLGRRLLSPLGPTHFETLEEVAGAAVAAARQGARA